jgi:hypothetical protein
MVSSCLRDGVSIVPTDRGHWALRISEKRARQAQLEAELGARQRVLSEKRRLRQSARAA